MELIFFASAVYWVAQALAAARSAVALRVLEDLPKPTRTDWPLLSLIVPARDEGCSVQAALRSRLNEGYPALEVVVVDDRSTDDTGAQARALSDPRLTVTRIDTLPAGWLGKVHALQRGLEVSRGEWILFSDADVHLTPGTLQHVIAWAEAEGVDHVAVLPAVRPGDARTALSLTAFFRFIVTFSRLWAVERPQSTAAAGVGAFNLFRRSAYQRTPGLEWLKLDIGDDMALAVMLKRAGASARVLVSRQWVSLQFYSSFAAMRRALEKNGAQAPAPLMLAGLGLLGTLELGWLGGFGIHPTAGVLVGLFAAVTGWCIARWLGHPRWPTVFPGLGFVPLAWVLARATVLAFRRGGVVWRDTFYSTAELKAGRRLG